LLTACSGGSSGSGNPAPGVASLTTTKASAPSVASSDPNDLRPLVRFDATTAERQRSVTVWWACLEAHGVPKSDNAVGSKPAADATDPKYRVAGQACLTKEPEDYKEREKRTDPTAFADHNRAMVSCLAGHGLHVKLDDERTQGWRWTSTRHEVAEMDSNWIPTCERKAFHVS
jgi:hypothetical protein